MKRVTGFVLTLLVAVTLIVSSPNPASACPMCKAAAEQDENQPKAYMYSILFMLAMPAVIFGSFGYGLYRMNQRETELESLDQPLHSAQDSAAESDS
ncbi:MAG: hypothetical protein HUJ26_14765 [Planctomycetaceae bacterium]|nr:hypothetical protein [Planctomycetaceae bacterium]